ncbi:MAG TPA: hypothetical protein EYP19_07045, partial [Desulfobacterales bacterium]|nr:hypothetical protein [Desulfobacterales bacterium]
MNTNDMHNKWLESMNDPFRDILLPVGEAFPERVARCAAPLEGEPAFDPEEIQRAADSLYLPTRARFSHPKLERVVRVGLAHIDATFQADHPKY